MDFTPKQYKQLTGRDPLPVIVRNGRITWELAIDEIAQELGFPSDEALKTAAERLVMALTGDNRAAKVSYGTEAGKFQQAGMSTVICGPGHIAQAHKPNEFIDVAQIEACEAFMRRLMDRLREPL